jgi:methanogenic corrinoid protein MtbC1
MMLWTAKGAPAYSTYSQDLIDSLEHMRAVLAEELPPPVAQTAAAFAESSIVALRTADLEPEPAPDADTRHGRLLLQYLEALLEGERDRARDLILAAARGGVPFAELYTDVLQPALAEIGNMWHRGAATVADEHLVAATTQALLVELRSCYARPEPRSATAMAAAVGGDLHELGLRVVADFLEMDGWRVRYLGANMPANDIVVFLEVHPTNVLVVSATTCLLVRETGELIESVRASEGVDTPKIIVGGRPFDLVPDLWEELGADACAHTPAEAVQLANRLIAGS